MTASNDEDPVEAGSLIVFAGGDRVPRGLVNRGRILLRDQRVRFVLVGGINTVVGLLVFIAIDVTLGRFVDSAASATLGSIATLTVAQAISVVIAFVLQRRLVFRVRGHLWLDFMRFQSVYIFTFTINLVLLPTVVSMGVPRIAAQAAIIAVMTVVSYIAHRNFTFRRKPAPPELDVVDP